jgi:hypothetical protein
MRTKSIVLISASLVLAIGLVGCSSAGVATSADVKNTTGGSAAPAAPSDKVGTRANPAPAGTAISLKDISGNPQYTITIGAVTMDAGAAVTAANQFNAAAKPGFQYMLIPVNYTYVGKTTGTPGIDVSVEFVSAAGTTHKLTDSMVVGPAVANTMSEIYPGASASGNVIIMVPTADAAKGLLTVSGLFAGSKFFVKLA